MSQQVPNDDEFRTRIAELEANLASQSAFEKENARLAGELGHRDRELAASLAQQSAMAEVLSIISTSPTDAGPVLETITQRAAELCGADEALVLFVEDGEAWAVTRYVKSGSPMNPYPSGRRSIQGRHLGDAVERKVPLTFCGTVEELVLQYPQATNYARSFASDRLTVSAIPLLRGDTVVAAMVVIRGDGVPFTEQQERMVRTFADQAIIAIENARVFGALQERNREVTEAFEQQTAMAEVLQVISGSPTELQAVLETLARNAARLADGGQAIVVQIIDGREVIVASTNPDYVPGSLTNPPTRGLPAGRAIQDRATVQMVGAPDEIRAEFPEAAEMFPAWGIQASLAVPLMGREETLGALLVNRKTPRPFTERQVALLETFASQAVIAIENARLFNELQERNREVTEALGQQTAMAEVLNLISRAQSDVAPVLDAIAERAVRLCDAQQCVIYFTEEDKAFPASLYSAPGAPEFSLAAEWTPTAGRMMGEVTTSKRAVHFHGTVDEFESRYRGGGPFIRAMVVDRATILSVPLMKDGENVVGNLAVVRGDGFPYSDGQVALLESFADQAVIAIENARLLAELRERTDELEVASRHKSEFLANMSHELRTPLNAIIGYSELLQEECTDLGTEDFLPDLGKIRLAGRHLLTLISGILDLSKVEAGRMTMFLEDFDIATLVRETDEMVRPLVGKNSNVFVVDCPGDIGAMHADLVKCRQVLFNLLSNAAKFTEAGKVSLTVRREAGGENVTFAIRDSGIGITAEQVSRLFEAFGQADASTQRRYGGTGLGLALSRSFCQMMGGDIAVDSAPGEGSTFTVTLPATVTEPEAAESMLA